MVVALCDDDRNWAENAQLCLEKYMKEHGQEVEVLMFQDGKSLLEYDEKIPAVVFMDIALGEDSGIEITKTINERWRDCQVVFVTNYLYYAVDVYQAEHCFFVLKEQFEQKLPEIISKLANRWNQGKQKLYFNTIKGPAVMLRPKEILYFERVRRITLIHTILGTYEIWDKIGDIVPKLSNTQFVRCHNSFIVNMSAIRALYKNAMMLEDGTKISISRSYSRDVEETFARWAKKQML